uniref:MYB-CC type transcription factor LHEQLE-containing domain-containing protein n=1 Tax=Leersia perrieri TaxID=77586 RepID=A0A0D9VGP7_9ORYZ
MRRRPSPAVRALLSFLTSQLEWKQQIVNELESSSHKQNHISSRGELVKEKIILSQEKMIRRLNGHIQNLQQQLTQCRDNNMTANSSRSLTSYISEIQRQQMMDD